MMNLLDGVEGQSGNGSSVAAPAQTEEVTASTLNAESDAVAPDQVYCPHSFLSEPKRLKNVEPDYIL